MADLMALLDQAIADGDTRETNFEAAVAANTAILTDLRTKVAPALQPEIDKVLAHNLRFQTGIDAMTAADAGPTPTPTPGP